MKEDDEKFKEILPGYEISTKGRLITNKYFKIQKEITPFIKSNGYLQVKISINGIKQHKYIHRLVAEAFIPNPDNLPEVNHKDGNKQNNNVSNLEWCTKLTNMRYVFNNEVYQLDKNNKIINKYPNCRAAAIALGKENCYSSILSCARGCQYYKTACGYKLVFVKNYEEYERNLQKNIFVFRGTKS